MVDGTGAVLIVEQGMDDASIIPLDQRVHVIGKPSKADILVNHPFISHPAATPSFTRGRATTLSMTLAAVVTPRLTASR
jgi:hypothetical protein